MTSPIPNDASRSLEERSNESEDISRISDNTCDDITTGESPSTSIKIPLPSIAAHSSPPLRNPTHVKRDAVSKASSQSATETKADSTASEDPLQTSPPNPRLVKLQTSIDHLQIQVNDAQSKLSDTLARLRSHPSFVKLIETDQMTDDQTVQQAQIIVSKHIKLLHQYNEMKDVGLGLLGLLAEKEGKRLGEIMEERGINGKD